ncbi:MAG TPA: hypothetical protein VGF30_02790 [Bacteroidia bacterium]
MENKDHISDKNESSKKNRITIFENPSVAAEEQAKYSANQTPIERLRETVEFIKRVYSYSPDKKRSNKIFIDVS